MKKLLAGLSAAVMIFTGAQALPAGVFPGWSGTVTVSAAEVNATEVTLYHIKEDYKDNLSLPADKLSQFQLSVTGAKDVSYSVYPSYSSVQVSDSGLITVKPGTLEYWYFLGGGAYSWYYEPQNDMQLEGIVERFHPSDATVNVRADGKTYSVNVHVVDYGEECYKPYLQNYIKEHIKSTMTDEEKIAAICALPASFGYSILYQRGQDLVFAGGGDCWAGTALNVDLAHELGLEAWGRNANHEGARGHRNAVVVLNGNYYILEQFGSWWKKADPYFSFESPTISTEGTKIYQYDGRDDLTSLEIPSTISGKKVVELGESCFTRSTILEDLKTLTIPEGVEKIGDGAISGLTSLETVTLPSTLTDLGASNFSSCPNLKSIIIPSSNPKYTVKNGMILTKDGTELLYCFGSGDVTVPSTVKRIADRAFANNSSVTSVTVPASVTEIGNGAFYSCNGLSTVKVLGNGLEKIGDMAFAYSNRLTLISLPASVTELGQDPFYSTGTGRECIVCPAGSAVESYAKKKNIKYASAPVSGRLDGPADARVTFSDDNWDPNDCCFCSDAAGSYYVDRVRDFDAAVSGAGYSALVPEGDFTVTASAAGYVTRTLSGISVTSSGKALDIRLCRPGDMNGDGSFDASDANNIKSHLMGVWFLDGYDLSVADADQNGKCEVSDYNLVVARAKGLIVD